MSMRSTTPKKGLFDNIIKDLEQDKAKYSNTPRKSLSFSVEDKENFRFTLSDSSPSQTGDRDRTFQIDHLKETYGHSMRGKAQPRRSVDAFRDLGDSVNNVNMNINAASMRTERPPLKPATTGYLQGNTNKLRMREKLKKLKITKAELTQVVKEIEMEKMKVTELKQSIFGDIRKSYDEFVKKDEMKLKEDMNRCLAMIYELQELELGTEIKLEKFNSILDEDISSMEEALKKYESIEIGKYKPSNLDLKLIEKERLEELENEVRAARNETKEIKESSDKFRQLHETSIQLNQILTQKAEDLAQQLEKTEVLRRDHKTLEDEWRRQEDNYEASLRQLERERDELRDMVDRAQDTANFNLKRELEKQKTNFADELWQINGFIKRIGLNLTQEFPVKMDQEGELNSEQLVLLVRQNLNELGKAFEKGLERERNRLEAAHKDQEKVLMEEYNKYKENLNAKIESEKDELKDALTQNFKKKTDELLQETWALKSQISSMVASEEHQKLKQALEEKEARVKELEDEKKNLPQKIEAEVIRRTMEVRRDNLTSMGLLKDKHEKELIENAEQFKEMYENMLEQERAEGAQLREENQFLTQELESANKQIFELMKYKADYADLESERRKLEEKNFTSNEMRSLEYENKLKALQENNDKTIKFLEDKLEKMKRDSEREKYEVKETVDQLRSDYEAKIEELRVKYQAKVEDYRGKMEAFGKFKEGHERSVGEIAGNLRNIKEQLAEREQIISAKDREIQGLTHRLEHFEQENRGPSMQSLDRSLKPLDSSRMKQKRIMNQIIEKVNNLGEVLSGHARTAPGTVKSNVGNQDIRPLYQIGKELEILTKELDNDLSLTEDFGTDSMTEKSFDLLDAQKEGSKLTYKMLNMSDSSKSHQRKTSGAFHDPSKSGDQSKQAIAIQADFKDDSIFPPFDHRVCLRCRKNDLTSPSYCKYANIQKLEDLSFQSQKSSGSYKVSKNHIYGTNVAFKSKIEPNPYANFRTKGMMVHCVDKAVNTIISNNDFASKDASMGDEDLIELLTPKTDTKRQIKIEMR